MRSLWMSSCNVTMNGCRQLAREMPRLNVEVMKEEGSDDIQADKVYVYRSVAGPRRRCPSFCPHSFRFHRSHDAIHIYDMDGQKEDEKGP
ncbi:hypothetical protein GH714_018448 [Hevea brasiliensis]|uniref:Uncharacterized protein n=1 Tax=Hevea brasiliensis TaxID=3981 RepID=A0A6A6LV13_HEVBR|nr:hypothetical protein GH714_018448 [Hevea brasiliensis]